ncbi:MAG: branched-chain amino acid aminotransferase [Rhodobacteraceae bacterium]|nr:branched-chain amino acid aminotransferase [Paracoccaceae bacterium]
MALGGNILTWFNGEWREGNTMIMGAADHATWLGSMVFDGARYFDGTMPDLDLHSQRIIRSAKSMGYDAPVDGDTIEGIIREGVAKFAPGADLYLRPMMWSVESDATLLGADPTSGAYAICIEELPMPEAGDFALTVSPYRRPRQDMALTDAKAACLYPNNGRIAQEAVSRGFNTALSMDIDDNVAETSSTNVFLVRDGEVFTPTPNGTFLNGITRQRMIALMKDDGLKVTEASLTVKDFTDASEIFLTGNASKITPVTRFEDKQMPSTQIGTRARALYWEYAHSS